MLCDDWAYLVHRAHLSGNSTQRVRKLGEELELHRFDLRRKIFNHSDEVRVALEPSEKVSLKREVGETDLGDQDSNPF